MQKIYLAANFITNTFDDPDDFFPSRGDAASSIAGFNVRNSGHLQIVYDSGNGPFREIEVQIPTFGPGLPYLGGPTVLLESAGLFSSVHAASP